MKKANFYNAAMSQFILPHTEKLILGVSIVLLGSFFWTGFQVKPFADKTPDQLVDDAEKADEYINSPDSWDAIKDFRKGDKSVAQKIRNNSRVESSKFNVDPISGIPARTLDPRLDPTLFDIENLEIRQFKAPVIVAMNEALRFDPFAPYPSAGGLGPDTGSEFSADSDADVDDVEDDEFDGGGRGSGRSSGRFGQSDKPEDEATPLPELEGIGNQMQDVNVQTYVGIRPTSHNISGSSSKSFVYNVVCVTGLVNYKQQWNAFESSFSTCIGFYPDRDKPIYQYLQVHRRELGPDGKPAKGKLGEWSDQSELITFGVPSMYPQMHRMPKSFYNSAPDVVAPDNFDSVLTGPIPSIVMFDYRPFVNHSTLANSTRMFPEFKMEQAPEEVSAVTVFTKRDGSSQNGSGSNGGKFRGGDGTGMNASNGPGGGLRSGGRSGARGRPGAGGRSGAGRGLGGGSSPLTQEIEQTRSGTDFTDYVKAMDSKKPNADYRLVRFFDVLAQPGKSYEYRMRAWVSDPNNEDLSNEFANLQDGGAINALGNNRGSNGEDEDEQQEDDNEYTRPSGNQQEEKEVARYVQITSKMLHPSVRIRLNRHREVEDPKTGEISNWVSEVRGKDAEGKDIVEEIKVPMAPIAKDEMGQTIYSSYLKHTRPTNWSKTVKITIKDQNSQVAGGQVTQPKPISIKIRQESKQIPAGEPVAEIAASVWWKQDLGTALPTRQTVRRGDALDFYTPAYFLHPVTWQVHVAKNLKVDEGEAQFLVPIETGNVVVDVMGGQEIPLPRTEKMRHNLASEVLVMNEYGEFHVKNEMADRTIFRNMLFLPDESQTVGRKRVRNSKKDDPRGGGGKFGGGGGSARGGDLGDDDP